MATFQVSLVRSFHVTIDANSSSEAARLVEYFLGYFDESTLENQIEFAFKIQ